jgi:hypothetical protein
MRHARLIGKVKHFELPLIKEVEGITGGDRAQDL